MYDEQRVIMQTMSRLPENSWEEKKKKNPVGKWVHGEGQAPRTTRATSAGLSPAALSCGHSPSCCCPVCSAGPRSWNVPQPPCPGGGPAPHRRPRRVCRRASVSHTLSQPLQAPASGGWRSTGPAWPLGLPVCVRVRAHVRLSLKACGSGPRGCLSISGEIFGCPNLGMPLTPCNVPVCPRQYGIIWC